MKWIRLPKISDPSSDADAPAGGSSAESDGVEQAPVRRGPRRRGRADGAGSGISVASAAAETAAASAGGGKVRRHQQWNQRLSHLGAAAAFRPYLFVAGVLVILVFLLYNESVIADFEEQANEQVNLYAQLIAFGVSEAANDQMGVIFNEVIEPDVFPIIVTDHQGEITLWEGHGLPEPDDRSPESLLELRGILAKMDEKREPISFDPLTETDGLLHYDGRGWVLTSVGGAVVGWGGPGLPASTDTASAAVAGVRAAVGAMDRSNPPRRFTVSAGSYNLLHYNDTDFVITDGKGENILSWWGRSLPLLGDRTQTSLQRIRNAVHSMGVKNEPLTFQVPSETIQYLHYGDSRTVSRLSWANFSLMGILILFLLVGYVGFRNIRRSEQRSIWVGMAKETAHQLGTPLSSVSGWLELIRSDLEKEAPVGRDEATERLSGIAAKVGEMEQDLQRLNQIALRFSQIGSVPELEMADINSVLAETVGYFRSRGPQFGQVEFAFRAGEVPEIPLNRELLSWAFENLCKNGIDAIGNKPGRIAIGVGAVPQKHLVQITVQDNGRGIEPDHVDQVFEPGFSTKKRGWGLGLAFVKRIIEEYHNGRISITRSASGEGTTFEVLLPTE